MYIRRAPDGMRHALASAGWARSSMMPRCFGPRTPYRGTIST